MNRNHLKDNLIEDNGTKGTGAGIRIRGETNGLVFENNTIRDTREPADQTQSVGVLMEERVGSVTLVSNQIDAQTPVDDRRKAGEATTKPLVREKDE